MGRTDDDEWGVTEGVGAAEMLDRDQLLFTGERRRMRLAGRTRWTTTRVSAIDTITRYGHPPAEDVARWALSADFITAERHG